MAILVRERELREEVARLTRENSRLGGLRAAVESVIAAATRPHPKDATVTICEVCDVAAAGIEHERGCYVDVLAMALKRAAPASDQPAIPQPAPDVQAALVKALEGVRAKLHEVSKLHVSPMDALLAISIAVDDALRAAGRP